MAVRFARSQFLQPVLVVGVQAPFNNVDQKNTMTTGCLSCSRSAYGPLILPYAAHPRKPPPSPRLTRPRWALGLGARESEGRRRNEAALPERWGGFALG